MLFIKLDGSLVEIKRLDFKNDMAYYQKIMDLMMEKLTEKKALNVLNSLNCGRVDKDDFVNAKIGNIDRILQKL
jgi:predicted signal transduction protein with EAL and GGDEF domain